jgi:hypothetical protein
MKFSVALNTLTVFREQGDKRFNSGSQFLYAVKKTLLSAGIPDLLTKAGLMKQ